MPSPSSSNRGYLFDRDPHSALIVELVAVNGAVIASCQMNAPLNKDATAQIQVRLSISHECGCRRELQAHAIRCY
jgi:hypothetical protein